MKRREFITLIGGIAAAWPLAAHAQQKHRVAVLMGGLVQGDTGGAAEAAAFESAMKALGWKPGVNIEINYRWPGAELDQVRAAAKEIVSAKPDVVLSRTTPATMALKDSGLPVVFTLVADPVSSGLVERLGRPGGNITGFSNFEVTVGGKWLELLKEAAPQVLRVALLFNPATAPYAQGYLRAAQAAAQSVGASLTAAPCSSIADIETTLAAHAREGGAGVIVMVDSFLVEHRDVVIELASRYRLPAIYGSRAYIASGGLMAYSADYPDIFGRSATYVDRILKGTRPSDLPVQEPAKYILSVNLKTANAIGLKLPQNLIAEADEVIE